MRSVEDCHPIIQQHGDPGSLPLTDGGAEGFQNALHFAPLDVPGDRLGKDRLERLPLPPMDAE